MTDHAELSNGLRVLGATPNQTTRLQAEPERALGWIRWAQHHGKGIAAVLAEFATGDKAPDINDFYAAKTDPTAKRGADHPALLRACRALVANTGHEYDESDLLEEFDRLSRHPKVGNGATLGQKERELLLEQAARMRESHAAGQPERKARDDAITLNLWVGLVRDRKLTPAKARELVTGYFAHDPEMRGRILEVISDRKQAAA